MFGVIALILYFFMLSRWFWKLNVLPDCEEEIDRWLYLLADRCDLRWFNSCLIAGFDTCLSILLKSIIFRIGFDHFWFEAWTSSLLWLDYGWWRLPRVVWWRCAVSFCCWCVGWILIFVDVFDSYFNFEGFHDPWLSIQKR